MMDRVIGALKKHGFTMAFNDVLVQREVHEIGEIINSLFTDETLVNRGSANSPVVINLAGKNLRLDELLEKLVSHQSVKSVLTGVLGGNYKIWQLNARRSEPGDDGLYLHQDAPGETNLALLLSDNSKGHGATAFLPDSHKLPRWAKYVSWSSVRLASFCLKPLLGKAGDTAFFFNRTWHMRLKNHSSQHRDVILISFFPSGATYTPYELNDNAISLKDGSELKRLLDPTVGTKKLEDGRYKIISDDSNKTNTPFSLQLEGKPYNLNTGIPFHLYIMIGIFEVVFRPIRFIYRVIKP